MEISNPTRWQRCRVALRRWFVYPKPGEFESLEDITIRLGANHEVRRHWVAIAVTAAAGVLALLFW